MSQNRSNIPKDSQSNFDKGFVLSDEHFVHPKLDFVSPYFINGVTLVVFLEGECKVKINLREWHIKKNTLLTIFPGSLFIPIEKSDDLKTEFIFFPIDFLSNWNIVPDLSFDKLENQPCYVLDEKQINDILDFHYFMLKKYKNTDETYRDDLMKLLLNAFVIELINIYKRNINSAISPKASDSRKDQMFNRFILLVSEHHTKERKVSFYANQMCITDKHLGQVIKKASGRLAASWISYMLILSIKSSLHYSQKSIAQISEDFNFPNPSFFNQFFKKHTNLTPKKYREGFI